MFPLPNKFHFLCRSLEIFVFNIRIQGCCLCLLLFSSTEAETQWALSVHRFCFFFRSLKFSSAVYVLLSLHLLLFMLPGNFCIPVPGGSTTKMSYTFLSFICRFPYSVSCTWFIKALNILKNFKAIVKVKDLKKHRAKVNIDWRSDTLKMPLFYKKYLLSFKKMKWWEEFPHISSVKISSFG